MAHSGTLTLTDLEDPARFIKLPSAVAFRPHQRSTKLKDGSVHEIVVDVAEIHRIHQEVARKEKDTNSPAIVIREGHLDSDPKAKEKDQPETFGYARFHLGVFGEKGEPALYATRYFEKDKYDRAKAYKHWSAEYEFLDHNISGLALLKRPPWLDLGVLDYSRDGHVAYYAMDKEMGMSDPAKPLGGETPHETAADQAAYRQFCNMMTRYVAEAGTLALPGPEATGNGTGKGKNMATDKEQAEQYAKHVQEAAVVLVKPVQDELAQLREANAALQLNYARAEARAHVNELTGEQHRLLIPAEDEADEVETYARLDKAEWPKRDAKLLRCYRRDPTGGPEIPLLKDGKPAPKPNSPQDIELRTKRAHAAVKAQMADGFKETYEVYYAKACETIN